jgi:hypothetical protein
VLLLLLLLPNLSRIILQMWRWDVASSFLYSY